MLPFRLFWEKLSYEVLKFATKTEKWSSIILVNNTSVIKSLAGEEHERTSKSDYSILQMEWQI